MTICGADRHIYDVLAENGIPDDPITIRNLVDKIPDLWEEYKAVETIIHDFLCTQKSAPDDDRGVLVEMPTFVARRFVAQIDDADEPTIDELAVAVRIASALADRITEVPA